MPRIAKQIWAKPEYATVVRDGEIEAGLLGAVVTEGPRNVLGRKVLVRLSPDIIKEIRRGRRGELFPRPKGVKGIRQFAQ